MSVRGVPVRAVDGVSFIDGRGLATLVAENIERADLTPLQAAGRSVR